MKCKSCQRDISEDFKLCPYCGEPVVPSPAEPEKELSADALKALQIKQKLEDQLKNQQLSSVIPQESKSDEEVEFEDEPEERTHTRVKKDKPKTSGKKTIFIVLFMLIIVLSGVLSFFFLNNNKVLLQSQKQIEAGDTVDAMDLVSLSKKNEDKYTYEVAENNIKPDIPGKYDVTYNLIANETNNKKEITFEFEVIDTTAPEISADDPIQTTVGKDFSILNFVTVSDIVDGVIDTKNVTVDGEVDTNTVGTYPLNLSVTDKAGNKATKTVNVAVEDKGNPNEFMENISGQWLNTATNIVAKFSIKNGVYQLDIGYYKSEGFGTGVLTIVDVNGDNTVANFSWDYKSYHYDDNNQIQYTDVETKAVVVDTGVPKDNKISIDLGDEYGKQEYRFLSD